MVGVTLVHRKGYFRQRLDAHGNQTEEPAPWSPETRFGAGARASNGDDRGAAGSRPGVAVFRPRPVGAGRAGLPLGYRLGGKHRLGSHADGLPLRRRPALPALPGSHPRRRRRRTAPGPRVGRKRHLSHERRPLGIAGAGTTGRTFGRPDPCNTADPRRCPAAMRVHYPHAGPRGTGSVSGRLDPSGARGRDGRHSGRRRLLPERVVEHDSSGPDVRPLCQRGGTAA